MNMFKKISSALVITAVSILSTMSMASASNLPTDKTVIGYSPYTGWEAYAYIKEFGIMESVNSEFGTNIEIRRYATYDASLSAYAGGTIHGLTMTNMDALALSLGVPSVAIINGDTSHGNDAVIGHGIETCADMKGKKVYLFTQSISHTVLSDFLATCGLTDADVTLKHVASDGDIPVIFAKAVRDGEKIAVSAWNPQVYTILENPKAELLFNSAMTEGKVLDSLYARDDKSIGDKEILALNEMWYRAMAVMMKRGSKKIEMIKYMAETTGATKTEFEAQMKTTRFLPTKAMALKEVNSDEQKVNMAYYVKFLEDQDMLGDYSDGSEFGIKFADGTVLGDSGNVIMTFTSKYLK